MAGLKSLAQELQSKGRNGDTILAHINPQEAGILKALGGSGTINPHTGLPEYFGGGFFKSIGNIVAAPFKAVNEVVKAIPVIGPAIDKGLVSLDKAVGSTIPGGWNTLAQTALAFTPIGLPAKVGLAALGGSGAFGPNGKFNLQRALMSGAMAYGMNQLTSGLQAAGGAGPSPTAVDVASSLGEGASSAPGSQAAMLADLTGPGFGSTGGVASSASYANPSNLIGSAAEGGAQALAENAPTAGMFEAGANPLPFDKSLATSVPQSLSMPSLSSVGTGTMENLAAAGRGITNLSGFGTGAGEAASAFAAPVTTKGMAALGIGAMGLSALDEEQKFLDQQYASGNIAQAEYDAGTARINESRARSEQAMRDNPYQFNAGGDVEFSEGDQVTGYAAGGQIKGYAAGGVADYFNSAYSSFADLPSMSGPIGAIGAQQTAQTQPSFAQSPYESSAPYANADTFGQAAQSYPSANQNPNTGVGSFAGSNSFYGGGGSGGSGGAFPLEGQYGIVKMAAGGMLPRFLSGGGDGMSDSIRANIEGKQEARLADGEFVIPADVVSHLGNGSSKAGAKQLYAMMDRVRQARVGNKKQGKQINPRKYMAA